MYYYIEACIMMNNNNSYSSAEHMVALLPCGLLWDIVESSHHSCSLHSHPAINIQTVGINPQGSSMFCSAEWRHIIFCLSQWIFFKFFF